MPRRRLSRQRGSAYLLVLSVALIVTVVGLSAVAVTRANARLPRQASEWTEAGTLASAAVEHAISVLEGDPLWRTTYTCNVLISDIVVGDGALTWKLVDPDGSLSDDASDPVRIVGFGKVGGTVRMYSVELASSSVPLPVLKVATHAVLDTTASGTVTAIDGPFSTAATYTNNNTTNGNIEALTIVNLGTINGTQTIGALAKTMPSASVWDTYFARAKDIAFSSISAGTVSRMIISKGNNPYGDRIASAAGVYHISVPAGSILTIRQSRLEATLLVTLETGATVRTTSNLLWEPARADYPTLIVRAASTGTVDLTGATGSLSESTLATNFNPSHTPYNGQSDTDMTDSYPSEIVGLVHVIGALTTTKLNTNAVVRGAVVAEGNMTLGGGAKVTAMPSLAPVGYTGGGGSMTPVAGSWRWEKLP